VVTSFGFMTLWQGINVYVNLSFFVFTAVDMGPLSILALKLSIKHSFIFLLDCIDCLDCHILFFMLCCIIYIYSVMYAAVMPVDRQVAINLSSQVSASLHIFQFLL